jgi:hypothetical protein
MNIEKNREKLSQDLGLKYESQDWGIINANHKRIREFIDYYQKSNHLIFLKYDLIELIIASFNDYEISDLKDNELEIKFSDFIKKACAEIDLNVYNPFQYWIDIADEMEYPVGKKISTIILPFVKANNH